MASPRHRLAPPPRRKISVAKVAAPIASLATLATVGAGVLIANPPSDSGPASASIGNVLTSTATALAEQTRPEQVSRSATRDENLTGGATYSRKAVQADTKAAVKKAKDERWTTEGLNLWSSALADATQVGEIEAGEKVLITGRESGERAEIVVKGEARWVTAKYLSDEKPLDNGVGGVCSNGTSVAPGVSANIVKVHQAVCARFPEISTYGTFRGDGEHSQGLAVDIMVSGARGWEIADYIRANYQALGVSYVIYSQKIWSVQRSGEGWRGMSNRGSTTANHYDHVHVTTY
ncbi:mucin-2 protein [Nocardioides alcanivorans]|uniref:mucin-2 protein n=1 Tax=Nocardioides alcanivorans TaxID=2897352 RepID=UPI001F42AA11|nr:mucin-2 protein [Nocardioides alcanivorans]